MAAARAAVLLASSALAVAGDPDLGFDLLLSGVGGAEVIRQPLAVEGVIPSWLNGILIQNGGGRFEWPNALHRNLTNAGDGYAKLEMFTFRDGNATFTSKFARSEWWNNSVKEDDIAPSLSFGVPDPPRRSDKEGLPNVLAPNDNLAVNIVSVQDRLLLISDQPGSIEFSPHTLDFGKHASPMPGRKCAFTDVPPLPRGMMGSFGSAHPLWTGSSLDSSGDAYGLLNVQRLLKADPRHEEVRLFKISAEEQQPGGPNPWLTRRTITRINVTKSAANKHGFAPYMHSFFLVGAPDKTHAVLVQHAMNIAMATLIEGLGLKPISAGFDIELSRPMVFYVINLASGDIEHSIAVNMSDFTSAAANNSMIVSHIVNGYFDQDQLVLDVIGYDFLFFNRFAADVILNKTARDHGPYSGKRAKTFRFVLDLLKGAASSVSELLPQSDWEFPIINEAFKGQHYCYAYGYEFSSPGLPAPSASGMASMAMVKYNVCAGIGPDGKRAGQVFTRRFHYFVEPWFVPRPGGTAEDDGVVLVLALDGAAQRGVLYVLDARSLGVLATMKLPILINLKTHGRFVWGVG